MNARTPKSIRVRVDMSGNAIPRIAGFLLLCVFLQGSRYESPPQLEDVRTAIDRSAHYLVNATRENGMFEYLVNMDPDIRVKENYNILRHAGAIYAMSMHYQLSPGDNMLSAMQRAG